MRRADLAIVMGIGLLLPVGCGSSGGGGGGGVGASLAQLQGCTEDGLGYLFGITLIMDPIVGAIENGSIVEGVTVDELDAEQNIWSFAYLIDFDGDGIAESTLSGQIDFSEDPSDGIASGTTSVTSWNVAGSGGLSGSGTFNFAYDESGLSAIYGSGSLNLPDGCEINFDVPVETPLNFNPNGITPVASVLGAEIYGIIEMRVRIGSDSIFSVLTLTMGSNTVQASGVELNNIGAGDFSFVVDLTLERIAGTLGCLEGAFLILGKLTEDMGNVVAVIVFGNEFPGDNLSFTETGTDRWSFTADWPDATATGTLTVTGGDTPGSTLIAALTFDYSESGGAVVAQSTSNNPLTFRATIVDTEELAENVVVFGQVYSEFAAHTLAADLGSTLCTATITIPSDNAVADDYLSPESSTSSLNPGARMNFDIDFQGDNLRLSLVAIDNGDGIFFDFAGMFFNNIPVPFDLIGLV